MFCPYCGEKFTDVDKFCPHCGATIESVAKAPEEKGEGETGTGPPGGEKDAEATQQIPPPPPPGAGAVAGVGAAVPPPPGAPMAPTIPAQPAGIAKKKKAPTWLLILIPVVLVVIIGGVVAGILLTRSGTPLVAEIEEIKVTTEDGKKVSLKSAPLNEGLVVNVKYKAQFPDSGEGVLKVAFSASGTSDTDEKEEECKSSEKSQTFEWDFSLGDNLSEAKVKVGAVLEVKDGSKEEKDEKKLSLVAEKGEGGETTDDTTTDDTTTEDEGVKAARELAIKQLTAANQAVQELQASGIETADLMGWLQLAQDLINRATTYEELAGEKDSAVFYSNFVLNECGKRKEAHAKKQEEERKKREQPSPEYYVCPTCDGWGDIVEYEYTDYWVTCGTCGGAGGWYDEWGDYYYCTTCGGQGGWYESDEAPIVVVCPTCGGTGWIVY